MSSVYNELVSLMQDGLVTATNIRCLHSPYKEHAENPEFDM